MKSASTARVLNLARRRPKRATEQRRLFRSPVLERAIIVKHRLRPHERDWFVSPPSVSTKLLIPIDPLDMQAGAHSLLMGQRNCREVLNQALGLQTEGEDAYDYKVLTTLDELPTLDPFLTREHLKRREIYADDDYFEISDADVIRMLDFVKQNIVPLVTLCFGAAAGGGGAAERLAQKILAADMDATMEPLRQTLKMDGAQFLESIFCWKGFLYYKWVLAESVRSATAVAAEVETVKARGKATAEEQQYIRTARARLQESVKKTCREVKSSLDRYDEAFAALTQRADPIAFRDFLLAAPDMFFRVGDRLGAIQHIVSFWRYRFRDGAAVLTAPELYDILLDFEQSLGSNSDRQSSWG